MHASRESGNAVAIRGQGTQAIGEVATASPRAAGTDLGSCPMSQGDLVGFAEIVELLAVPERTAARYVKRTDFPDPIVRLAAGPVWHRADVEDWAKEHIPSPGS